MPSEVEPATDRSAPAQPHPDTDVPLGQGDEGQRVVTLQRALKALGYSPGRIDGMFGQRTDVAVGAFQRDHDLKATGTADERTLEAINDALDSR